MPTGAGQRWLAVLLGLWVPAAAAGCASSQAYPHDQAAVWQVAVGEAVIWRPDRIDEKKFHIEGLKRDLGGQELQYDIDLRTDWNVFARRPSTRVFVSVRQTKPRYVRFDRMEKDFLLRVQEKLQSPPPAPGG
jgi:hypothetical protein